MPDQAETGARFGGGGGGVRAPHFTRPLASRGLLVCAGRQAVGAGDVASMTSEAVVNKSKRPLFLLSAALWSALHRCPWGGPAWALWGKRGAYTYTRTVGQIDR